MASSEKTILATTVCAHALIHVCELTFPATALLVTKHYFGAAGEYEEIGAAAAIFGFMFGLAALPAGRLVDRLGARTVLLGLLFGTGASMIALALAPNFVVFSVILAVLGAFAGLYHPAGTTMLSLGMKEHGKAMGAHGMGGNFGLAITPFLAAALAGAIDWRLAYAVIGSLPIALGLAVLVAGVKTDKVEAAPEHELDHNGGGRPYLLLPLALLFIMAVFNGMTYRGLMTFLPAYFAEHVSISWLQVPKVAVGGGMTTVVLLLGVAGQYLGGRLADRVKKEKVFTTVFFITAPLLAVIGMLSGLPLVAVTGVFAFMYFMNQPVGNAMIPTYASPRVRGMVFGLFFFMNFGAGSIMSPIAGWVGERFELSYVFGIFAGCILMSGLLGIGLVRATRGVGK